MIARYLRAVGAMALLAAFLVGVPWLLLSVGTNPFAGVSSIDDLTRLLLTPSSGAAFVGIVTVAAWAVWAVFVVLVIIEAINLLSRHRVAIRLPGLGFAHRGIAVLLLTVVAAVSTSVGAAAEPTPEPVTPTTTSSTATPGAGAGTTSNDSDATSSTVAEPAPAAPAQHVHVVQPGDYLVTLAEHYLGDESQWHRILDANPGLTVADGLNVGQHLTIPIPAQPAPQASHDGGGEDTITVHRGDTLSSLAQEHLGDSERWTDLYNANRDTIADPDQIDIGQQLDLPRAPIEQPPANPEPAAPVAPTAAPAPPTTAAPAPADSPAATQHPQPEGSAPEAAATVTASDSDRVVPAAVVGVGALLTAGLVLTLARRRRRQMLSRQPGQQIPAPDEPAGTTEAALRTAAAQQPFSIDLLDQVMRALGVQCRRRQLPLPQLRAVRLAPDRIDLICTKPHTTPPPGVKTERGGRIWTITPTTVHALTDVEGIDIATHPWPGLVTLGRDNATAHILIDLESASTLTVNAATDDAARATLRGIAVELAVLPWVCDLTLILVGDACPGLDAALDEPEVHRVAHVDEMLDRLERRASEQRHHLEHPEDTNGYEVGQLRIDPAVADAWTPTIVFTDTALTTTQADRLEAILNTGARVAIAAVTPGPANPDHTGWTFNINADGTAHLAPHDLHLTPQRVDDTTYDHLLNLLSTSGRTDTTPAPWWNHTRTLTASADVPDTSPALTPLQTATSTPVETESADEAPPARRPRTTAPKKREPVATEPVPAPVGTSRTTAPKKRADPAARRPLTDLTSLIRERRPETASPQPTENWKSHTTTPEPQHPQLQILGPVQLIGARGDQTRSPQRCMELMMWVLTHPRSSSATAADALFVARSTIKSVARYLRVWLGNHPDTDSPYLPDGTTGYALHADATSDWHQLQRLIAGGANTTETTNLVQALALVRGAPFTGSTGWEAFEGLRSTIPSTIADIAHTLTERALEENNIDMARWATAQGLTADPGSELLLADRARTEHAAGNTVEVDRLARVITQQARDLGCDLTESTADTLRAIAQ